MLENNEQIISTVTNLLWVKFVFVDLNEVPTTSGYFLGQMFLNLTGNPIIRFYFLYQTLQITILPLSCTRLKLNQNRFQIKYYGSTKHIYAQQIQRKFQEMLQNDRTHQYSPPPLYKCF